MIRITAPCGKELDVGSSNYINNEFINVRQSGPSLEQCSGCKIRRSLRGTELSVLIRRKGVCFSPDKNPEVNKIW